MVGDAFPSENQHLSNRDRMIDCVEVVRCLDPCPEIDPIALAPQVKRDLDDNRTIVLSGNTLK